MNNKTSEFDKFSAFAHMDENNTPIKISVFNLKDTDGPNTIEFFTDAVDCMGFSSINNHLSDLDEKDQKFAVNCFADALVKNYGGKNFLAVPQNLQSLFEGVGFRTSPETPTGNPYQRLMFVTKAELTKRFLTTSEKHQPANFSDYTIVSDRKFLLDDADKISRLLIDNATYAGNEDKRKAYSVAAIKQRIANPNVIAFALYDSKTKKPIAFLRVYNAPDIGAYASDLVVDREAQGKGISGYLMYQAYLALQHQIDTVYLIAGDDKEALYYQEQLGCQSICSLKDGLKLANNKIFMFRLIPRQHLLNNLLDSFPMPEPPQTGTLLDAPKNLIQVPQTFFTVNEPPLLNFIRDTFRQYNDYLSTTEMYKQIQDNPKLSIFTQLSEYFRDYTVDCLETDPKFIPDFNNIVWLKTHPQFLLALDAILQIPDNFSYEKNKAAVDAEKREFDDLSLIESVVNPATNIQKFSHFAYNFKHAETLADKQNFAAKLLAVVLPNDINEFKKIVLPYLLKKIDPKIADRLNVCLEKNTDTNFIDTVLAYCVNKLYNSQVKFHEATLSNINKALISKLRQLNIPSHATIQILHSSPSSATGCALGITFTGSGVDEKAAAALEQKLSSCGFNVKMGRIENNFSVQIKDVFPIEIMTIDWNKPAMELTTK